MGSVAAGCGGGFAAAGVGADWAAATTAAGLDAAAAGIRGSASAREAGDATVSTIGAGMAAMGGATKTRMNQAVQRSEDDNRNDDGHNRHPAPPGWALQYQGAFQFHVRSR